MALIHEKLYRSKDLSRIDASEYLQDLAKDLVGTYRLSSSGVSMNVDVVPGLVLGIDTAIHCGLIVNELVSNALKYAFPDERLGEVWIRLEEINGGEYLLEVKDNGVGLPEGLDLRNTDSLGLQLVSTVVDHLEGRMEIHRQDGTRFEIVCKEIDG
jgi:two-component sensor histidine kinase